MCKEQPVDKSSQVMTGLRDNDAGQSNEDVLDALLLLPVEGCACEWLKFLNVATVPTVCE